MNILEFQETFPDIPLHVAEKVQPILASEQDGVLTLHSGPRAGDRAYFDTEDGSEHFVVYSRELAGVDYIWIQYGDWVRVYGTDTEAPTGFEDNYVELSRSVTTLIADGGTGDDTIDASGLVGVAVQLTGGLGNDELLAGSAGGVLAGGAGDDTDRKSVV